MLNVEDASVYTDFNSLAKLKKEAKEKTPEAIKEVAKQFESVFVGMMMKSMRQASLAEGIMDSSQSDFYRDMYDQQLSVHLAGEGGIGLADVIAKQLSPNQSSAVVKDQRIGDYERQVLIRHSENNVKQNSHFSVKEIKQNTIDSAEDFVNQLRPYATQAAKELGVDTNLLLSQAALETGWGKSIISNGEGNNSHNLFNIKADNAWQGQKTNISTLEFKEGVAKKEIASFRHYDSYKESFDDYVDFIKSNSRYQSAIKIADKPEQYMRELQQAGYATDPDYAAKVMRIYQGEQINGSNVIAMKQDLPERR